MAEFAEKVFVGADYSVLTDYISTETYHQHNPEAADGLDGFGAAAARWAEQGKNLVYKTVHRVIAEGEFVLTQSEGEFGVPVACYDLFRVADGKIVEHWDVVAPIPSELPHGNGLF
ncbi:nuclear transport factor 2 family protein [Streptomyces sp. NPDC126510]|uniref:nuclear transport factor 2 family protein n=1 Tax=Streptomyces sp. NPDC126510 TaxID=3155317 RepID=UPI003332CB8C